MALTILKCQLIVERTLDNIISFTFAEKTRIARAYRLRKDGLPVWQQIGAINALRNDVAHNLAGEKRGERVRHLRQLYLSQLKPAQRSEREKVSDADIVVFACADAVGFLAAFEEDLVALRDLLDAFDAARNPDQARAARKPRP